MKSERKLLFLGCSVGTEEALEYAKETGIYTILTDYNPPEISTLKKVADEYWMTDVADVDELEEKCRQEFLLLPVNSVWIWRKSYAAE